MTRYAHPAMCAAFAVAAALALSPAANAGSVHQPGATRAHQDHLTDVSSAKKKRRTVRHHRYYAPPPAAYGPPAYSMWRGADPSYGPGTAQFRQFQREGRCVIDEGYGRYSFCSNR